MKRWISSVRNMEYKVIITPPAMEKLDAYICYTIYELKNIEAAKAIKKDARETAKRLVKVASSNAFCEHPILKQYGYRKQFFGKHRFIMIYRIDKNSVIVEGMYHELQDYESIFIREKKKI